MRPFIAVILLTLIVSVDAAETGRTVVVIQSVHDGDTFTADRPVLGTRRAVRLRGADTAEINGRCRAERMMAELGRRYLAAHLGETVSLTDLGLDKYPNRVDARVRLADGSDLSEALVAAGLAVRYDGGRRIDWCS